MRKLFLLFLVLLASCALAVGQVLTVRGTVKSAEDGGPLPQLTVLLKGTTTGVVTNLNGEYVIRIPNENSILVFKYTGYETQEIPANGRSVINVMMKPALEEIDQVVVTAYGSVKKQSLVGSQNSMNEKELERRPVTNAVNALAATSPGVQITTSTGQPGSTPVVRIRGFGSVNASSAPIYVVDGVKYDGDIGSIAPQDIASISVLKDAASTALYGSSAGNGVILITTKSGSGKAGTSRFTFTTNQGFSQQGMPTYDVVDAMGVYPLGWQPFFNTYKYGMKLDDVKASLYANIAIQDKLAYQPYAGDFVYIVQNPKTGAIVQESPTPIDGMLNYPRLVQPDGTLSPEVTGLLWGDDTDWAKALFRLGYRQEYILSGGMNTEKLKSYMSFSYLNEEGYKIETTLQRLTARFNATYDANKWITLGGSVAFTHDEAHAPRISSGTYAANSFSFVSSISPIYPIHEHNPDGSYVLVDGKKQYDWNANRPFSGRYNPVASSYLDLSTGSGNLTVTRGFAEVHIFPFLDFKVNGAFDGANTNHTIRFNNKMGDQPQGLLEKYNTNFYSITFNQLLDYHQAFGKHEVGALLGHESYLYRYGYMNAARSGATTNGIDEFPNYAEMRRIGSTGSKYRKEGYFARVNYDYSNLYNLSVSYRLDGSSRFAPDKRWGNFWSFGAGWHISNEAFMQGTHSWLSEMKLRFSVGQTGNDDIGSYYPYKTLYNIGYKNLDYNGIRFGNLGNKNLVWESQTSYDLALEFGIYNRARFVLEGFIKESKDLIFSYKLPTSSGISSQERNIGKIRNYGIEFSVDADLIRTQDWRWNLNINGTWYKTMVVQLPELNRKEGIRTGLRKYTEGREMYEWYIPEFIEVDPENGRSVFRLDSAQYGVKGAIRDEDGNPTDRTYQGNLAKWKFFGSSTPDLYGGISTTLTWRDLELSMLFSYQIGGLAYDNDYQSLMGLGVMNGRASHVDLLRAWRKPGDITDVPALYDGTVGNYIDNNSQRWLIDGSGLMFKNISLTYHLPKELLAPLRVVKGVRIGVQAENLFLLSRRKGLNPFNDLLGNGGSKFYEFARTFTATLSVNF